MAERSGFRICTVPEWLRKTLPEFSESMHIYVLPGSLTWIRCSEKSGMIVYALTRTPHRKDQ